MRAERLFMKHPLFDWKHISHVSSNLAIIGIIGSNILLFGICPVYYGCTRAYHEALAAGGSAPLLIHILNFILAAVVACIVTMFVVGLSFFIVSWIMRLQQHIRSTFI